MRQMIVMPSASEQKPQYVPPTSYMPPTSVPKGVSGSEQLQMEEKLVNKFNTQIAAEETKARQEFQKALFTEMHGLTVGQRTAPETKAWMAAEKEKFEVGLKDWKAEQKWEFDKSVSQWRYEYYEAKRKYVPSIAEMMLGWTAPVLDVGKIPIIQIPLGKAALKIEFDIGKFITTGAEASVAAGAGFVGGIESFIYPVMGVAGFKTPAPPPTVTGALVQTGISSIIAGEIKPSPQFEEMQKMKYPVTYAASTVLSDLILGYVISKGVEKAIIQPIGKTRVGKWIGYQYKLRAPEPLLRLTYGKKGAHYIAAERTRLLGERVLISPTGQVVLRPSKDSALFKQIMTGAGLGKETVRKAFPVTMLRGKTITPFKTTLARAMGRFAKSSKASAQIFSPLSTVQRILTPTIPTWAIEFGVVPLSPILASSVVASTILGVKAMTVPSIKLKVAARIKPVERMPSLQELILPTIKPAERLKVEQEVSLAQIIMPVSATIVEQMQMVGQVQALKMMQLQRQALKLELKKPKLQEEKIKRRRRRKGVAKMIFGRREYLFPTTKPKGVAAYVFGRRT